MKKFFSVSSAVIDVWLCSFGGFVYPRGNLIVELLLAGYMHMNPVSLSDSSLCLFSESLTDRVGRRRSMPGSTVDKTVVAMDADTSTPFKVTVRNYDSSTDKNSTFTIVRGFKHLPQLGVVFQNVIQFDFRG